MGVAQVQLIYRSFQFAYLYVFFLELDLEFLTEISVPLVHFLLLLLELLDQFLVRHVLKLKLLIFLVELLALALVVLILTLEPHKLVLWHVEGT